jgi:subtilase family serine protease
MGLLKRPRLAGIAAAAAIIAVSGGLSATAATASTSPQATPSPAGYATVSPVIPAAAHGAAGSFSTSQMSIEIVLAPGHQARLSGALTAAYANPAGSGHWLAKGQFAAQYAPAAATRAAVEQYLRASGLSVSSTGSAFLVRASGTSAQVSAAFRTKLSTYKQKSMAFFANSTAAAMPATLAKGVLGVVGLNNTVRIHAAIKPRTAATTAPATTTPAAPAPAKTPAPSCELPYPTVAQFVTIAKTGVQPPTGYGAAPGCNGLSPSQENSIYGAPSGGPRTKGKGVTLGLFELSAYQASDVKAYTTQFFGPAYNPPLVNVNVDGGPLAPQCPVGDTCPAEFNAYAGDIEVDADIETQLAVAPDVAHVIVYNAPNDETGQTALDEYAQIANDDTADSVSSSWGECENDISPGFAQAENLVFEQMALQGQSMFGAAGDDGAFDCIGIDGSTLLNVDDPPSQPWVTSVGGTSLQKFNPGEKAHPAYPAGVESVWNPGNLCNAGPGRAGLTGFDYCNALGGGGGGNSQYWGRPFYQFGPGVTSADSTRGNGGTHCSLATRGTLCREVPDISANADQFTPYGEFCTGSAATPNSVCATFSGGQTPPGWFGVGGTSLSSPLWSAVIADRDSFTGHRAGNINPLVYLLYRANPKKFFHDITGIGQTTTNNGHFATRPGYDLATGIGTPIMAALITGAS